MDEGPLGEHEVEFVVQSLPGFDDGRCVGEAAERALHLGQVRAGHDGWRLVIYAHLEPRGTPLIPQLNRARLSN